MRAGSNTASVVLGEHVRSAARVRAAQSRGDFAAASPVEGTTDRAPVYPRVLEDVAPGARRILDQYANNAVEADHGRLKARLRPMRGLKRIQSARTIAAGHAFVQSLCRGHYELTTDVPLRDRLGAALTELADCL